MYRPTRRHVVAAAVLCSMLGFFGVWVLLHPASIWVQPWRATQSIMSEKVIFGPYPVEEDFVELKGRGVTTIVSLLDSNIPYEKVLLAQERERAARHGMQVLNFPMASILGQSWGRDYLKNSEAAARAALDAPGTAYIHCYLGLHRAKRVREFVQTFASTTSYVGKNSERPDDVAAEERAAAAFRSGNYKQSLTELAGIENKGIRATRWEAWSHYRLQDTVAARTAFERILAEEPQDQDAHVGLAYCELSDRNLPQAEERFTLALARDPNDVGAIEGLAHVRYRQGDPGAARPLFEQAAELNPANTETRQMLGRLKALPPTAIN